MKYSIIIPARNEEDNIQTTIVGILQATKKEGIPDFLQRRKMDSTKLRKYRRKNLKNICLLPKILKNKK